MLPWPLIPFLALPWIGAPAIDAGPEVHAARCGDARPWRAWVEPSGPGLLLVELEGAAGEDVDLGLADGDRVVLSLAHSGRERVALPVHGPVAVAVWSTQGQSQPATLRVTWVPSSTAIEPGAAVEVDPEAGPAVFHVESPRARRYQVELAAEAGGRLTVLDPRLAILDDRPAGAHVRVPAGPGQRRYLWVRPAGPATLTVRAPGKGVKALPRPALDRFLDQLAATPDQRVALAALRRNPDFQAIRAYLLDYPGGSPLQLRAAPGLRVRGAERFGSYSRGRLTINPTIEGHTANVQELMDTLIHELVHALLALPAAPGFPLDPAVRDMPRDPRLDEYDPASLRRDQLPGTALHDYLEREYGPSASNPERDYIDVNAAAQHLIAKVIEDNLRRTGLGHETLVFENIRARRRLIHADQTTQPR